MKKNTRRLLPKLLVGLVFAILPLASFAQDKGDDEPVGIFASQSEYHEFMGTVKGAIGSDPEMRGMILMINDVVTGQPIGTSGRQYGGVGSNLGLLSDPAVRENLEMIDSQYEELQGLNAEVQSRLGKRIRSVDFSGLDPDEIMEKISGMREEADAELQAMLLPHQSRRLKQIHLQSQLRRRTLADLLSSDPIKSELEVTEKQADELKAAEEKIEEELEKEIAKLRAEAREKLIATLTPEQQEKAKGILGEMLELTDGKKRKGKESRKGGKMKVLRTKK